LIHAPYNGDMKLSRRRLAQSLAFGSAAAISVKLSGQPSVPPVPNNDLEQARASLRAAAQVVRNVKLPMSTEPAAQFHAKG
jgi:hypothetical protein